MRVLVSSTEGAGHCGPLLPVVEAAARRGDDVLFVISPGLTARVEATGHLFGAVTLAGWRADSTASGPLAW